MVRILTVVAGFGVLAAAAVAHGLQTDRWGPPGDLRAAADRLDRLPTRVGDWDSEAVVIDPRQVEGAQVAGFFVRRYTHRYTNVGVSVMILCGRPGPVSVHTPDVCYRGAGYAPGTERKQPIPGGGEMWAADFAKDGPNPERLRIHWAWSTGGELTASDSPRTEFAREKVVYKVYLIRPTAGTTADAAGPDPELGLLAALMPDLRTCFAPVP